MLLKRGVAVLEDAIPAPNAGCKISNGANTVTITAQIYAPNTDFSRRAANVIPIE